MVRQADAGDYDLRERQLCCGDTPVDDRRPMAPPHDSADALRATTALEAAVEPVRDVGDQRREGGRVCRIVTRATKVNADTW